MGKHFCLQVAICDETFELQKCQVRQKSRLTRVFTPTADNPASLKRASCANVMLMTANSRFAAVPSAALADANRLVCKATDKHSLSERNSMIPGRVM